MAQDQTQFIDAYSRYVPLLMTYLDNKYIITLSQEGNHFPNTKGYQNECLCTTESFPNRFIACIERGTESPYFINYVGYRCEGFIDLASNGYNPSQNTPTPTPVVTTPAKNCYIVGGVGYAYYNIGSLTWSWETTIPSGITKVVGFYTKIPNIANITSTWSEPPSSYSNFNKFSTPIPITAGSKLYLQISYSNGLLASTTVHYNNLTPSNAQFIVSPSMMDNEPFGYLAFE